MADFAHWLEQEGSVTGPKKPFWALDFDKDEDVLRWLNDNIAFLKEQAAPRHGEQRKNLAAFRGIRLSNVDTRSRDEQATDAGAGKRSKSPRVIYNHHVDVIQQHVSRLTKFRGAIAAVPPSDDHGDRMTALIAEDLITKYWDKVKVDRLTQKHHRRKRINGEDFIGCFWNYNLGPYDMDWLVEAFKAKGIGDPRKMTPGERSRKLRELGEFPRIAVKDEKGNPVRGSDNQPLYIDRPIRRGEVEYRLISSLNMFLQRVDDYERCEHGTWREWIELETLKAMHPKVADKIAVDPDDLLWDADQCEMVSCGSKVEVFHTYHKSTDLLDQGRYVKWCRTAVLINKPNPYLGHDHRAIFPWVRTVDIDTPDVLNGDATMTHCRGPAAVYNNLVSMKVRNRFLTAYPKWFVPQNSVNTDSLTNSSTIVPYKGPTPPVLGTPRIEEGNDSVFMQESKNDFQQIAGVYGISRGEPPKGITAAVALTFLDEKENEGANISIQDHTTTLDELALQTLWLMADHYAEDDGRMEELLGKKKAHLLKDFKCADLRNVADMMVQNMTALPQQKSAKLQFLLEFKKEWPEAVPPDVAIDVLGLGEVDRLKNAATVALRKAEEENWAMINGGDAPDAIEGEFHMGHYESHRREMNEPAYNHLPEKNRKALEKHIYGTEMLMWNIGQRNPAYLQLVQQKFPDFPLLFVPESMAEVPEANADESAELSAAAQTLPQPQPTMPQPASPMVQQAATPLPPGAEAMTTAPAGLPPGAEALTPTGV